MLFGKWLMFLKVFQAKFDFLLGENLRTLSTSGKSLEVLRLKCLPFLAVLILDSFSLMPVFFVMFTDNISTNTFACSGLRFFS